MRQKRNSQNRDFLFPVLRIDNTCSNRSQDAWRSHALRVAVGKCCQLRQTKSTMRAAKGHAKHRASGTAWVAKSECCQFYYQNRQCRQRLVKRSTGEARTVWTAIRRRCQFYYQNRAIIATQQQKDVG